MPYGRRRIRTAVVGAVLAVAALAGCTGSPAPRTGAAASTGPTPTPTPTPTPVSLLSLIHI